jgi:DNA-binding NarL/FixJ family response regulator
VGSSLAVSVLVVADEATTRAALVRVIAEGGFAAAGTGGAVEAGGASGHGAVVIVDGLRNTDAIDLVRSFTRARSAPPVLAVVPRGDDARVIAAIRAGARACLYDDEAPVRLAAAVREVLGGGNSMSRGMAPLLFEHIRRSTRRSSAARTAVRPLTDREREALALLARGLSYEDSARVLEVSLNTLRTYVRAIYDKLEVASRTEAVLIGIKLGIIKGTPFPVTRTR